MLLYWSLFVGAFVTWCIVVSIALRTVSLRNRRERHEAIRRIRRYGYNA